MKVELIRESAHGEVGEILSRYDAWQLCFPVNGCVAKPVDAAAIARVCRDLEETDEYTRRNTMFLMRRAGSSPYQDESGETPIEPAGPAIVAESNPAPLPAPEPAPVPVVKQKPIPPQPLPIISQQ